MKKSEKYSPTVVVGMSGGVDSAVTAALLKEQGFTVIGLFMKNWEEKDNTGECPAARDFADVVRVCEQLEIPYYSVDFVQEYQKQVFSHFLSEYRQGYTPNPDILCNREIKFKVFFSYAMELGADFLATGHYARCQQVGEQFQLFKGQDLQKDQSYFLYAIDGSVLNRVLFPLGALEKSQVRLLARKFQLSIHNKKDSTGICFIGERKFRQFLSQYISPRPGKFCHLNGKPVGDHYGTHLYTIGQRKGLGLGGPGEAWFVVDKNIGENVVYVERGERHPALYADELFVNDLHWPNSDSQWQYPLRCRAKIRYRQKDQDCLLYAPAWGEARVVFDRPQRAITPRQSIVFYLEDRCLGGGMIIGPGLTYYQMQKPLPLELGD